MAVKTVSEGFIPSWIVSSSNFGVEPGSGSGLMFGRCSKLGVFKPLDLMT